MMDCDLCIYEIETLRLGRELASLRAWVVRQPCEQFGWEREQGNKFCGKCFPCLERKRAESAKLALDNAGRSGTEG